MHPTPRPSSTIAVPAVRSLPRARAAALALVALQRALTRDPARRPGAAELLTLFTVPAAGSVALTEEWRTTVPASATVVTAAPTGPFTPVSAWPTQTAAGPPPAGDATQAWQSGASSGAWPAGGGAGDIFLPPPGETPAGASGRRVLLVGVLVFTFAYLTSAV